MSDKCECVNLMKIKYENLMKMVARQTFESVRVLVGRTIAWEIKEHKNKMKFRREKVNRRID